MKNLLILGAVRSGKTTVAKQLIRLGGFNYLSMDFLAGILEESLPETGIKDDGSIDEHKFNSVIFTYMNYLLSSSYITIVEGSRISPKRAFDNINQDMHKIVVFGYPNIKPEQLLSNIRNHENSDEWKTETHENWTQQLDDTEMLPLLREQIENSKKYQKDCEKLGIDFIDTSIDRDKKLDDFVKNILTFLS